MTAVYPPGATPLDPDELAGLIPTHLINQGQLNEWELANILEGEQWACAPDDTGWKRRRGCRPDGPRVAFPI